MTLRACLKSMRLRTLPLSLAGVVLGSFLALPLHNASAATVVLLLLTTALLQVLSNLSNELGDTLQGTDTDERQGIHYSLQDGDMTIAQMKRFITVVTVCCCASGILMVYSSFGTLLSWQAVGLMLLGAAAIAAAMRYTLGTKPYGYRGLGDIFVFIFFGLVSVCGGYYICSHDITHPQVLLPAAAIGCFSVGVLNVNNIRDMKSDAANRTTVALQLGERRAKVYQTLLIVAGWMLMAAHTLITANTWTAGLYVLTLPLFAKHLVGVWRFRDRQLDPMLPLLVISSFLLSLLAGIGMVL